MNNIIILCNAMVQLTLAHFKVPADNIFTDRQPTRPRYWLCTIGRGTVEVSSRPFHRGSKSSHQYDIINSLTQLNQTRDASLLVSWNNRTPQSVNDHYLKLTVSARCSEIDCTPSFRYWNVLHKEKIQRSKVKGKF